jgi:hypothetical protein
LPHVGLRTTPERLCRSHKEPHLKTPPETPVIFSSIFLLACRTGHPPATVSCGRLRGGSKGFRHTQITEPCARGKSHASAIAATSTAAALTANAVAKNQSEVKESVT